MMLNIEFMTGTAGQPVWVGTSTGKMRLTPEFLLVWDTWYDAQAALTLADACLKVAKVDLINAINDISGEAAG